MSQTPATLDRALWWLLRSEWRRSAAASVRALVVATVVVVGTTPPEAGEVFAKRLSLAWLALYLLSYLAVTFVLLRQPWERLARWAETSRDASWVRRYLLLLEPGAGLAVLVAFLALFYSVLLVVERTTDVVLVFGTVVLVAASWLTILVSFTLDYVRTDARHGWSLLDYPEAADGLRGARIDDYLYFATSVSTTFGTTDVTVRGSLMRRRVAVHGIIAFVFNTTVIAVVVNAMSALGS